MAGIVALDLHGRPLVPLPAGQGGPAEHDAGAGGEFLGPAGGDDGGVVGRWVDGDGCEDEGRFRGVECGPEAGL